MTNEFGRSLTLKAEVEEEKEENYGIKEEAEEEEEEGDLEDEEKEEQWVMGNGAVKEVDQEEDERIEMSNR